MDHDPFYNQIINGLKNHLDDHIFEKCCADLINLDAQGVFSVAPVVGGSDSGMDGAVADGQGEPFPLVTTCGKNVIGNLKRNLTTYIQSGKMRRIAIFATSQSLTPQKQKTLHEAAEKLGFVIYQIYEQHTLALLLYRSPIWCKQLLHLPGKPSPLSRLPLKTSIFDNHTLIGRDEAKKWLLESQDDCLVIGEPSIGKTALLKSLTEDERQRAFFVIEKERGELANAIRDLLPKIILVDDAQLDPNFLNHLIHLRKEIRAEFRIVASWWNGEEIADLDEELGFQSFRLKRLTRDQIVEVILGVILSGSRWLIQEIVQQAEGLPGIATRLAGLAQSSGLERIHAARDLEKLILNFYIKNIERHVRQILACFSVGGEAGMPRRAVVAELGAFNEVQLSSILRTLAIGGIATETHRLSGVFQVRPSALRHALIRDVFLSDTAFLSSDILHALIAHSPNQISAIEELIHVQARGGNIPSHWLHSYLMQWQTVPRIWGSYASLGFSEASWVLNNFPDAINSIANVLLRTNPRATIPRLLSEAAEGGATASHILKELHDWIEEIHPAYPQAVEYRRILFQSAKQWLLQENDSEYSYKAMIHALNPAFSVMTSNPGSGDTINLTDGYLTVIQLQEIQPLWTELMDLVREIPFSEWSLILDLIRDWAFQMWRCSDDVSKTLRAFAQTMIEDAASFLINQPEQVDLLFDLRHISRSILPSLHIPIAFEIDILYPEIDFETHMSFDERQATWRAGVKSLAAQWQQFSPKEVMAKLIEVERVSKSTRITHRLTPYMCYLLAEQIDDPLWWVEEMSLSGDLVFPFLSKVATQRITGWQDTLHTCLAYPPYRAITLQIILTMEELPGSLKPLALKLCSDYPDLVYMLWLRNELAPELLIELLQHENKKLVTRLVIAEWNCKPQNTVRDELRPLWEQAAKQAVIDSNDSDYWFSEIFPSEPNVAFEWLSVQLADEEWSVHEDALIAAIESLNHAQRQKLLGTISLNHAYRYLGFIVGNDISLYRFVLQSEELKNYILLPLASTQLNVSWQQKAKLAFEIGLRTSEEIASSTMRSEGVVVYSGKTSERCLAWIKEFDKLQEVSDPIIRRVGQSGSKMCTGFYKEAKEREDNEDVYGRS